MNQSGFLRNMCLAGAMACCAALTGCAAPGGFGGEKAPTFRDPSMTVEAASERIVPGSSTRADVVAALGPATVVRFDTGFEVWAYLGRSVGRSGARPLSVGAQALTGSPSAELVLLMAPSGILQKMRIRQPTPPPAN